MRLKKKETARPKTSPQGVCYCKTCKESMGMPNSEHCEGMLIATERNFQQVTGIIKPPKDLQYELLT